MRTLVSKQLRIWSLFLLGVAISYGIVCHYVVSFANISGSSMEPTFRDNDSALVHKYPLLYRNPTLNEIVIVWNEKYRGYDIKRIRGIPGDSVTNSLTKEVIVLKEGQYFVCGDNSTNSMDSRHYGPIKKSNILGIVK